MEIIDIAISSISFLTLREKVLLRKNIDSLDNLVILSKSDIGEIVGRVSKNALWNPGETILLSERSWKLMDSLHINGVMYSESSYPALLRETVNAPYMLFYRGNLDALNKKCISLVGTRYISKDSAEGAYKFARDAALNDYCVVSGLANGIDSFAHKGALASRIKSSTAAVLPCGIDTIVPGGNKKLSEAILQSDGIILSEYIPGCPAESWRFVQRNRIIAALSPATVVIHAPPASGALITADFALDFNRDLFFHSSGFTEASMLISNERKKRLLASTAKNAQQKLDKSPEKYIEDGAPIVESFQDFVKALSEEPGSRISKTKLQAELFD